MSNPVAVAFEKAKIADEQYRSYWDYCVHSGDPVNYNEVDRLAAIANDADRELEAARYDALNECSCLPDLPDGRVNGGRGTLCPVCTADSAQEWTP